MTDWPASTTGSVPGARTVLAAEHLSRAFGGVTAVADVSFTVEEGTIRAIIGPNGAGKTTLLDIITGFTRPDTGTVHCAGQDLRGVPPHQLPSLGLMRTFQSARLVPDLTVRDNVMLGAHHLSRAGFWVHGLRLPLAWREERALQRRAEAVLDYLKLSALASLPAAQLPTGTQRLVEVGRALAGSPRILLLDEPAAGLDESETAELAEVILGLRAAGMTTVLIEHNVNLVMTVSDSVLVLNVGRVIADGPPQQVRAIPEVVSAYLGGPL